VTPRDELPHGHQRADAEDRLIGCGLILGGLVGMGIAVLFWQFGQTTLAAPPGMPAGFMPMASPLACMIPIMAVLSSGLVLIGLRKLLTGE
jgi:hypothetical protein